MYDGFEEYDFESCIDAFKQGYKIKCVVNKNEYIFNPETNASITFTMDMLENGTWFVNSWLS
ncbi:MAG: hypothetical protein PHC62_08660 [Candidatus Izemoplasmatales bacterium]|nr:hypothetical protein [Candidatus Izemoplasmatales bacterium]